MINKSFTRYLAQLISLILIPPSILVFTFTYFIFSLEKNTNHLIYSLITTIIFGFIIPILVFLFLRMKRKIGDNDAKNKNERVIPLLYGIVINIFGLSTSLLTNSNPVMNHLWLCYVINTLIITLITINWKISAHTFGIASMIAALVFYFNIYFFFLAPLIFIIAWSRMELRIHTFGQVSSGSILGFVLTYIQLYFITILF